MKFIKNYLSELKLTVDNLDIKIILKIINLIKIVQKKKSRIFFI